MLQNNVQKFCLEASWDLIFQAVSVLLFSPNQSLIDSFHISFNNPNQMGKHTRVWTEPNRLGMKAPVQFIDILLIHK